MANEASRPRRRRGTWLPFVLILLGAVAVVGDRVAAGLAAEQLHARVVAELARHDVNYRTLDVYIDGFPFLVQVVRGRYEAVSIDLTEVRLPTGTGGEAVLRDLRVTGSGVVVSTADAVQGNATVTVDEVTGTALVSFDSLEYLIDFSRYGLSDVQLRESDGALVATATLSAAQAAPKVKVPVAATADIGVENGQFTVTLRDATALNMPVPPVVRTILGRLAERSITAGLPELPFGLTPTAATVRPEGVMVTVTGRDVLLNP